MKFRAVMVEQAYMREFNSIITTLSRLAKECVLRLTETHVYLIISEEHGVTGPPVLWCQMPQAEFFTQYHMQGLDDEYRDIYLGISTVILARCLSNLKSAKSIKIKLTKKQVPCLSLDIELPLNSGASSTIVGVDSHHVTHDINVSVIPRRLWADLQEPNVPQIDISLELPSLKNVRTTVDRLSRLSSEVTVQGSRDSRLSVRAATDVVRVGTTFSNLAVKSSGKAQTREPDSSDDESEPNFWKCRIDAKRLSAVLSIDQVAGLRRTLCSIVHRKMIVLNLETELGVKMNCFVPGIVF